MGFDVNSMVTVTDETYKISIFMLFIETKASIILWLCLSLTIQLQ